MPDQFFDLEIFEQYAPTIRESYIRAPFGWAGGKSESLKEIIPLIPRGETFVDGCGGSGIVTINSPDWFLKKIFNDRHAGIIAFYRCIRDPKAKDKLIERLSLTLHSREEFVWAHDSWATCQDDIERAARWYYMLRLSFAQLGRNFGRSITGDNMMSKKYWNGLDLFPVIHSRFKQVCVENLDVIQCIRDYDSSSTVFYIDPDYIGADPHIYEHHVEHQKLLDTIQESKGYFLVSGYPSKLYDSQTFWTDRKEWTASTTLQSQAFSDTNNLKGKENVMRRDRRATEVLWTKSYV